jgi:hypothetical protein
VQKEKERDFTTAIPFMAFDLVVEWWRLET